MVVKQPADFIDAVIGGSEKKAKGILASTVGKVLVIDEAYGLFSHTGSHNDPFKTAVIDTIVAEVQSVPGDDRCVLLLGYKDQMQAMLESPHTNPGLARRFPIAAAFTFEDFNDQQLLQILNRKLQKQSFDATGEAKKVALEMLNRARNRPNFGNGGEIDIILDATKARHQARLSRGEAASRQLLEARDFDEHFDRAERSETHVRKLFEGTVGTEETVARLEGYQQTVRAIKALDLDPKESIPFTFLFKGPPGTGKTTTARKMGKVFCDLGFLATAEVVEASASDLVAQYVGQTGPKVRALLERALGKVLFVDEAYRLAEGHFAQEAVDELVDSVTKERYHKKLIIVLAGYDRDIDRLTAANEGLSSRFPEAVLFRSLGPRECAALLTGALRAKAEDLERKNQNKSKKVSFDIGRLTTPRPQFASVVEQLFLRLSHQAGWANARDVKTLAEAVFSQTIQSKEGLKTRKFVVSEEAVLTAIRSMLQERESRGKSAKHKPTRDRMFQGAPASDHSSPPPTGTGTSADTNDDDGEGDEKKKGEEERVSTPPSSPEPQPKQDDDGGQLDDAQRDAGVSDAVWAQLQRDRRAEREREDEYQRLVEAEKKAAEEAAWQKTVRRLLDKEDRANERQRRLEEQRRAAAEAERQRLVRRLLEADRRRQEEAACRRKLQQMGVCPMGFRWIRQASGYRCAGGAHFVAEEALKGM